MSADVNSPSARDLVESGFSLQSTPDSSGRQQYRRYRKHRSSGGFFGQITGRSPSSPLGFGGETPTVGKEFWSPQSVSEDAWQEIDSGVGNLKTSRKLFPGEFGGSPVLSLSRVSSSHGPGHGRQEDQTVTSKKTQSARLSFKIVKKEPDEEVTDSAEESYGLFAWAFDATFRGQISIPELMLEFEAICRDLSERVREEATDRHRVTEDRLMRQKAQMLHAEAATWALIWHLRGKGTEDMYMEDEVLFPPTSEQEACEFISSNETAQLCLRIVQWLEGLASKELDFEKKHKGWYAGSYAQKMGVWDHTRRAFCKKVSPTPLVQHLDPDAPTREQARLHPEDQKLEEGLLEDIWKLLLAGRLEEARELCRSAGQAWRAASLGGCGELGPSPSMNIWRSKGKNRSLQALELESGRGHQRRLWKWACYRASEKIGENSDELKFEAAIFASQCANLRRLLPVCFTWEAACWAMVRSWLDVQVDAELGHLHGLKLDGEVSDDGVSAEAVGGPDIWPRPVMDEQPRDLVSLLQKLQSGDLVHDRVRRSCKEQQRLIQMDLIVADVLHLLELLRAWIAPPHDVRDQSRLHGHPQMIRFGAHLVLVLRSILADDMKENCKEKLLLIGDLILNTYAIFLFTQRREELVGVYAAHLAPHLCVDLYVHMMELRENESAPVKYKIFKSAVEYLPFSDDSSKGCVSDILSRVLSKSREIRPGPNQKVKVEAAFNHHHYQALQKANAVQWLCFIPPPGLLNAELLRAELLARALEYSNNIFREFSLISLWRTTEVPVGAHVLLSHLALPLKQSSEMLLSLEKHQVQENMQEFDDWREYYAFDGLYRNWLKAEHENMGVDTNVLSIEEKEKAWAAGQQVLDAASILLQRNNTMWLTGGEELANDAPLLEWLEVQVTAVLTTSSGASLVPDATVCTALTDAMHYCGADQGVQRQLLVDVSINSRDESLVDVVLRCLPIKCDGVGGSSEYDGGLLAAILAFAVKGELPHFQVGVVFEVLHMDAWYITGDGSQQSQATHIMQGLCRRCCLPEIILRCMQVSVALASTRDVSVENIDMLQLVASTDYELYRLFSQRQLQELLQFERSACINSMALKEERQQFLST